MSGIYREQLGRIVHHQVDEVPFWAGRAEPICRERLAETLHTLAVLGSPAREIPRNELARLGELSTDLLGGRIGLDRWPLRSSA